MVVVISFCRDKALDLPWLHVFDDERDKPDVGSVKGDTPIHISGRLKKFIRMSHFKRTALNVIAQQLTLADIGVYGGGWCRRMFKVANVCALWCCLCGG